MPLIKTMQDLIEACEKYAQDQKSEWWLHEPSDRFNILFSALLIGNDKKALKKRLLETVTTFKLQPRSDWEFQFEKQRLVHKTLKHPDGQRVFALTWNQSTTSRGGVGKGWEEA